MIPDAPLSPGDADFLTDAGKREWARLVRILAHRTLDVDSEEIADYAHASSFFLSLVELLARRGAVEIKGGKAVEAPVIQMLEDALRALRRTIADMGVDQPLPAQVSLEELVRRISTN